MPKRQADCPVKSNQQALAADDVLERTGKTYANCNSYQDSGVVRTVFHRCTAQSLEEKHFSTAFVRPGRFRFEFREKLGAVDLRCIVWSNGERVQTWWDVAPGITNAESLSLAIAGATGVSGGSAHRMPALLLPQQVSGRKLLDLTEAKRLEDAEIDNTRCFCIQSNFAGHPMTLWIDQRTYLVRRIVEQNEYDQFCTETTTTYDAAINEEIAASKLAFDPPTPK